MSLETIREWLVRNDLHEKNRSDEFHQVIEEKIENTNILIVFGDNIHRETEKAINEFGKTTSTDRKVILFQEGLGKGGGPWMIPDLTDVVHYGVIAVIAEPSLVLVRKVFEKAYDTLWSKIISPKVADYKGGWSVGRALLQIQNGKNCTLSYIFPQHLSPKARDVALLKAQKHFEKNYKKDDDEYVIYFIFDLKSEEWIEF